ncbi:hypothetical protein INR49_015387 [Caranx melampygus]|nr:hypothetical protein INR49_015387 [Caranx melampygus]
MNFISVLSCLSLLLAAAVAQAPKPCVSPLLMSGGLTVMGGDGIYMSTGTISYDAFGKRMRVRNFEISSNETFGVDMLMLFNQKVYYEIDWSKMSCKKKPLDATFVPLQVPSDAKLMGQVFMGSSSSWGMGVLVNTWYGDLPNNGMYTTVFSEIGCIPMTYTSYTPESGWVTLTTFNWVLGNTNPMDYIPPPIFSPLQMSGGFTVMAGNGLVSSTGTIKYDALGQRMRKVYYEIDWSKLSCKKKPLDATFIPTQVPSDAKLMGQVYMGSSSSWGMGVLVNTWYGDLPNNGTYSTVFSEIGCIPMTATTYSPESGWVTVSSFNWVLRKSNPKDYVPPFFCAKSQLEETETPDTVISALKSLAMKTKKESTSGESHKNDS